MQRYGVKIKDGKTITSRETYKAFKKYDRGQFDQAIQSIYEAGVEDGKPEVSAEEHMKRGVSIASDAVVKSLEETKGIGEKRREQVLQKFQENLEERLGKEKTDDGSRDLHRDRQEKH